MPFNSKWDQKWSQTGRTGMFGFGILIPSGWNLIQVHSGSFIRMVPNPMSSTWEKMCEPVLLSRES